MDARSLKVFLSAAELLNFGRASRDCNLSPSALTRMIQRLEEEVGQSLFVRDNRSVTLTSAGEQFQNYARKSLKEWQAFQESLDSGDAVFGTLSIYASVTAVYGLLPELLESYRTAYPDVQLELRTGAAEQAVEQVLRGEIDLAVAALPDRQLSRLEFLPMVETPLVFIASLHADQTMLPRLQGWLDLSRTPLVLPQKGVSRQRLDQWLKKKHISPNTTTEVSGNEAIIAMVRLGCGIGVVPELVLERSPFRDDVQVVEKAPRLDPYVVGLCSTKKNLQRPVVRALWEMGLG